MKSVIIGAGSYGEVYASYLRDAQIDIVGFLDDDPLLTGKKVMGYPVLGPVSETPNLREKYDVEAIYCPIGNNPIRVKFLKWAEELGYEVPSFIHRTVNIAPDVTISHRGVYILQGTQIMPWVVIDNFVMISSGSNIIHHSHLKEGTFVSNGVNFGARVVAEPLTYVGMGATVTTGVKRLGEDCLIGAGAVVIKDVPDHTVVAGVPAKVLKIKGQ